MSSVGNFIGDTLGGITGAKQAGEAGVEAGRLQAEAAREGIAENRRQFDKLVDLMSPFVGAGEKSLGGQLDLLGLNGSDAQTAALESLNAGGISLIVVTHDDEVAARSRRQIRMRDGRVVHDAPTPGSAG